MSTHNIGFYEEITNLSLNYHQICTLFLLLNWRGRCILGSAPEEQIEFLMIIKR